MINIQIEFSTPTVIGYAEGAWVSHGEYRDEVAHMEENVQWVKKALHSPSIRHPMVTFSYADKDNHEVSTARLITEYDGTYRVITWDDWGHITSDTKVQKADVKLLRKLYAHNVDRRLVYETKLDREGVV